MVLPVLPPLPLLVPSVAVVVGLVAPPLLFGHSRHVTAWAPPSTGGATEKLLANVGALRTILMEPPQLCWGRSEASHTEESQFTPSSCIAFTAADSC